VWSARSWQKRSHDRAQALLVRFAEPFTALAAGTPSGDRRDALGHAWRLLLRCQPHDSICGCSIDEVHREITIRLRRVEQMGRALVTEAVYSMVGSRTPDFALHEAIAILNPHPFVITAATEVELQRPADAGPFRLVGPTGELPYEILSRRPTDGPDGRPAEWLRLRLHARDLPPHGLRLVALEPGTPAPNAVDTPLAVQLVRGGLEIVDGESGLRIVHTLEDEGDRGDLYDFCPAGAPPRSSRDADLGARLSARAIGRRVEIEVEIDNRTPDHRLRARFDLGTPPASMWTDTPFGWIERTTPGTHPVSAITTTATTPSTAVALGGPGLHEVERAPDGALLLTLFRAVGWMSRGDLSTRPGHAGYHVPTPDAQGIGRLRFRYAIAVGADAVRQLEPGLLGPRAVALLRAQPDDHPFLSVEPAAVRLSIFKRADEGDALIVRLCGPPHDRVTARVRLFRPIHRAWWSDLDERTGAELALAGARDELAVPISANEVVTLRIE
jgi:hypothetical protein